VRNPSCLLCVFWAKDQFRTSFVSHNYRCYTNLNTMAELLTIPDEKRAGGGYFLRDKVLSFVALSFLAGLWVGQGFYWLRKSPRSFVWIAYFVSAPPF
jgi:hypothetical protein